MYTTNDYLSAIEREYAKRTTTYPKLIAKADKEGKPYDERQAMIEAQAHQQKRLLDASHFFRQGFAPTVTPRIIQEVCDELRREYKMRQRLYPRFVFFKRMTQDTATSETRLWLALCEEYERQNNVQPTKKRRTP